MRVRRDPGPCLTDERFAQVSAGPRPVAASTDDGMLYAWGYGEDGATGPGCDGLAPRRVDFVQGAVSDLSAGAAHVARGGAGRGPFDGHDVEWKGGVPCGNPPVERAVFDCVRGLPSSSSASPRGEHSLCLTASGEVYAWGRGGARLSVAARRFCLCPSFLAPFLTPARRRR